ncbi:MAG: hypothetical protein HFE68_02870 [Erysipelotrichaceae bacterium]|nr:hypothetical protein [Erysipelotrichaceae bacterium]
MWKKFCIALLAVMLLGSAAYVGNLLSAAEGSTLQFHSDDTHEHYIGNAFSYNVLGSRNEQIVNIIGGELRGNGIMYEVPFTDGDSLSISGMTKPGIYQGEILAEARNGEQGELHEMHGILSLTIYGMAYRLEVNEAIVGETVLPSVYGMLPQTVNQPLYHYTSSNEQIAQVDAQGYVNALQEGECHIQMQVYDEVMDEEHFLYETSTLLRVQAETKSSWENEAALDAQEHGFRFVQAATLHAESQREQRIGHIELPQTGTYRYELSEESNARYELRERELFLIAPQAEGAYNVEISIIALDTNMRYRLTCSYIVSKADEKAEDGFLFRYEGKDTNSIVRQFQEGNNTFQLASNRNPDEVRFALKNETDATYLTISEMGSVQIKEVTTQPVMVVAWWNQQRYELPIIIEKADQVLSCTMDEITVSVGDGAFDPRFIGRFGSGHMVGKIVSGEDIVSLRYNALGDMSISPQNSGEALIEFYVEGDAHYRRSNTVSMRVHVLDRQVLSDDWLGDSAWLSINGEKGNNGWFTSDVVITLQDLQQAVQFQYEDQQYHTLTLSQNGNHQLPIRFINEQGASSTPARVKVKIDTHAPIITLIQEKDAADREWKRLIDRLTFMQSYGTGKIVTIEASDHLMNDTITTSGVAQIGYRIYRMDEDQDVLLAEAIKPSEGHIQIEVDDTGKHRVCAFAIDQAGLKGEERCQDLDDSQLISIRAENSGMILSGDALTASSRFYVQPLSALQLQEAATQLGMEETGENLIGYHINLDKEVIHEGSLQAIIPLSATITQPVLWYQKQTDGTLVQLETQREQDAYVVQLESTNDIYYVEKGTQTYLRNEFRMDPVEETAANLQRSDTRLALRPLSLMYRNAPILIMFSGGVLIICLLILLIGSANRERHYDD